MAADALLQALVRGFVTEAQEICETLTRDLLELERATAGSAGLDERYDSLARGVHTLKGSAGSLGLDELAKLAHKMEDVVLPLKGARAQLPATSTDALLKGLDAFMARVRAHADEAALPPLGDVLGLILAEASARQDGNGPVADERAGVDEDVATGPAEGDATQGDKTWRVDQRDVVALMRELERLREVRLRLDERRRESLRALEHLSASLLASKGLGSLADAGSGVSHAARLLGSLGQSLKADAEEAGAIVDSLEERVKGIGTQPIRTIADPLHRTVRDMCRATGKEAKLSIVGGEISLDRRVLLTVKDALVQLVRNAVDHGIELPEEREGRGKHREGAIVVRVEQQGNLVFIEVNDDGRGIDLDRIRQVAVDRDLMPMDALAELEPRALRELIFHSGFTTARSVTETSGRGVGMDVVRGRVAGLRGRVDVESIAQQGTRFLLTLPVELGSSPLLIVKCEDHEFGVPMLVVERIVPATRATVVLGRTEMHLKYGDQLLTLEDAGARLGLRQASAPARGQPILVMQSQGHRVALFVDEVVGDSDFVIRPLPPELGDMPAFQGASTTARGELVLILRADWLVATEGEAREPLTLARRALVVDDSLTARAVHRAMLEAGGYTVHAVGSASQALDRLHESAYDVIVCDVAMQPMDGLAFTATLRARADTSDTPIILVSARDTSGDRERGLAAGADAFMSKSECASGRLLAQVSAVIGRRSALRVDA